MEKFIGYWGQFLARQNTCQIWRQSNCVIALAEFSVPDFAGIAAAPSTFQHFNVSSSYGAMGRRCGSKA